MRLTSELYATEQKQLCDKVIEILALDEQGSCWLPDLDADKDLQIKLLALIPDIRRYFAYKAIPGADNPADTKWAWLSVARGVTKPYYDWTNTEQQRNKKRSSLYTLSPKDLGAVKSPK